MFPRICALCSLIAILLTCFAGLADLVSVNKDGSMIYKIEKNDSLKRISEKSYGTTRQWKLIQERNALTEPLQEGQTITIPPWHTWSDYPCLRERKKWCSTSIPTDLAGCLAPHRTGLSQACRALLFPCFDDKAKVCPDKTFDQGLTDCLKSNLNRLSPGCHDAVSYQ